MRVPPKHPVHTALAAALRDSLLLCALLHSLADLTSSLLSRACHQATQICTVCQCAGMHPARQQGQLLSSSLSGLHKDDAQLLGKNSYNAVVPGELQGWPQSPQLSSTGGKHISPTAKPALCTWLRFRSQMSFVLISTQGRTTKQGTHLCHIGKKKPVNSMKSALYQINLILCVQSQIYTICFLL